MIPMRGAGRDCQLNHDERKWGGVHMMREVDVNGKEVFVVSCNGEMLMDRKGKVAKFRTAKAAWKAGNR